MNSPSKTIERGANNRHTTGIENVTFEPDTHAAIFVTLPDDTTNPLTSRDKHSA